MKQYWNKITSNILLIFNKYPYILIFLIGLIPLTWFKGNKLINGTDINFPLDPIFRFVSRLSTWQTNFNTGSDQSIGLTSLFFHGLQAFLAWIKLSLVAVEKVEFVFWFTLPGLTIYWLAKTIFDSLDNKTKNWAIWTTVCFYLFNIYYFNRFNEVDVATLSAYVAFPATLAIIIELVRDKRRWLNSAIVTSLVLLIGIGWLCNPPLLIVGLIALVILVLIVSTDLILKKNYCTLIKFIKFNISFLVIFLLLHSFWILPFQKNLSDSANQGDLSSMNLINWVDGVSRDTSFYNVVRLQGAWDWYEGVNGKPYVPVSLTYQNNILLIIISIIIPLLVLASLLTFSKTKSSEKKYFVFFWIITIVGILLSMGTYGQFKPIYNWLATHVPYFWLFRSPWYKFSLLTVTGYAILLGYTSSYFYHFVTQKYNPKIAKLVPIGIIILILIYAYPMLTGSNNLFTHTKINVPEYVFDASKWINNQSDDTNILLLPQEEAYNYTWGYGSAGDVTYHLIKRGVLSNLTFISGPRQGIDRMVEIAYKILYTKSDSNLNNLLALFRTNYLLHKLDSKYDDYGDNDSPNFIKDKLDFQKGVSLEKQIGEWVFYKFKNVEIPDLVYSSKNPVFINNDPDSLLSINLGKDITNKDTIFFNQNEKNNLVIPQAKKIIVTKEVTANNIDFDNKGIIFDMDVPKLGNYRVQLKTKIDTSDIINIDNIKITKNDFSKIDDDWVNIDNIPLKDGINKVEFLTKEKKIQILEDSSFEEGTWGQINDVTPWREGKSQIKAEQSTDSIDGQYSLEISSSNHYAATRQTVKDELFDKDAIYRLSFYYKNVSGKPPRFAILEGGKYVGLSQTFEKSGEWKEYSQIFKLNSLATNLTLELYTDYDDNKETINLYDGIKLEKIALNTKAIKLILEDKQYPIIDESVNFVKISPTKYAVTVKDVSKPFFLVFLNSFNSNWQAKINGEEIISENKHLVANGYANSWYLDKNGDYNITIEYLPQKLFYTGLIISGITLLLIIIYFLLIFRKSNNIRKIDNDWI